MSNPSVTTAEVSFLLSEIAWLAMIVGFMVAGIAALAISRSLRRFPAVIAMLVAWFGGIVLGVPIVGFFTTYLPLGAGPGLRGWIIELTWTQKSILLLGPGVCALLGRFKAVGLPCTRKGAPSSRVAM